MIDPDELWWPPAGRWDLAQSAGEAHVAPDGLTVQITALGGVLTEFLGVAFEEHDSYVVARPVTRERPVPPGTAVHLVAVSRSVSGVLSRPLGDRVLINPAAVPYIVTPAP